MSDGTAPTTVVRHRILPNKKIGQRLARFRQVNMDNPDSWTSGTARFEARCPGGRDRCAEPRRWISQIVHRCLASFRLAVLRLSRPKAARRVPFCRSVMRPVGQRRQAA